MAKKKQTFELFTKKSSTKGKGPKPAGAKGGKYGGSKGK